MKTLKSFLPPAFPTWMIFKTKKNKRSAREKKATPAQQEDLKKSAQSGKNCKNPFTILVIGNKSNTWISS